MQDIANKLSTPGKGQALPPSDDSCHITNFFLRKMDSYHILTVQVNVKFHVASSASQVTNTLGVITLQLLCFNLDTHGPML